MTEISKTPVVDTGVSAMSLQETAAAILNPPPAGQYVAVANVHSLMTARSNPELARVMAEADIVTPDGMPLVWVLKAMGHDNQERVHGMALADATIESGLGAGVRHFFYGSSPETLEAVEVNVALRYPGIVIAGTHSPPFRPLSDAEIEADAKMIRDSNADVVWVGLGAPKQELWMGRIRPHLGNTSLVGVGAVFDWWAGRVSKAPDWMQRSGLEWLYRLIKEPRRLWRRYAYNNPAFLVLAGRQIWSQRRSR